MTTPTTITARGALVVTTPTTITASHPATTSVEEHSS